MERGKMSHGESRVEGTVKLRGMFKQWTTRYAVLVGSTLSIFKDATKAEWGKAEAAIALAGKCTVTKRQTKKGGFCFKVKERSGKSIMHGAAGYKVDNAIFRVPTLAMLDAWLVAIRAAINGESFQSQIIVSGNTLASRAAEDGHSHSDDGGVAGASAGPSGSKVRRRRQVRVRRRRGEKKADSGELPVIGTRYEDEEADSESIDLGGDEIQGENKGLVKTLLKQVRPGMDLSKVVLPTFILEPRSFLEKMTDFFAHNDLLAAVTTFDTPEARMLQLTRWYLSGFYLGPKGVKKPYNPILGETFRCAWDLAPTEALPFPSRTHFYAEQVSHHPPISAFYVANRKAGFVVNTAIRFKSRFNITHVLAIMYGRGVITLTNRDEQYVLNYPKAKASGWFTTLKSEITDKVTIACEKTGYVTELKFKAKPMVGGTYNAITGRIYKRMPSGGEEVCYTISGKWNERIDYTDVRTGGTYEMWDTEGKRAALVPYKRPAYDEQLPTESVKLWAKVTQAIIEQDQVAATEEKYVLEQKQREDKIARDAAGEEWQLINFVQNDPDVTLPDFTYKHLNTAPFDWDNEVMEVEENGIIRSVTKNELDRLTGSGARSGSDRGSDSGWSSDLDRGAGSSDYTYDYTDESYTASDDDGELYPLRASEYGTLTARVRDTRKAHEAIAAQVATLLGDVADIRADLKARDKADRKARRELNSIKSAISSLKSDTEPDGWFSLTFLFKLFLVFWLLYISWHEFPSASSFVPSLPSFLGGDSS
ncbi:oxysterol-binding protein [Thecamonas trahens ATCC 50062]|uniref:Oxysterol-binding protein n=1 Tax=Thecamonas trahens ATCC 50062 TaxID=461836 RepID=A0A0L0DPG1_THETB|nr:oxysterol-binding protein [Thecamonas trahens ATCC 50062]KNC54187.1 oxysterol-binding protein [Thecamonas trahens ATCC 50062]|eukprot:XP_013754003.1 oxysterol-binding protein [Thecamonas trahens ATCC 50062]